MCLFPTKSYVVFRVTSKFHFSQISATDSVAAIELVSPKGRIFTSPVTPFHAFWYIPTCPTPFSYSKCWLPVTKPMFYITLFNPERAYIYINIIIARWAKRIVRQQSPHMDPDSRLGGFYTLQNSAQQLIWISSAHFLTILQNFLSTHECLYIVMSLYTNQWPPYVLSHLSSVR